jgi:orotidine-5'-phosphate decarboxylase
MDRTGLIRNIKAKRSFLCIGLDSEVEKIPSFLQKTNDPVFEFNKRIIDSTAKYTVAYKPNLAFYECNGTRGWKSLESTLSYIKSK